MADDGHWTSIQLGNSTDDRLVVSIQAITMQFHEICENLPYVFQCSRPLWMARDLDTLPWRQVAIDLLRQIFCFLLQSGHLVRKINAFLLGEAAKLLDFIMQFNERFFKGKISCHTYTSS